MENPYMLVAIFLIFIGFMLILYYCLIHATSIDEVLFMIFLGGSLVIIGGLIWPISLGYLIV